MFIALYVYISIHTYIFISIYIYFYIHIFISIYVPIYIYSYIHTYLYLYIHTYIHICIYMYAHIYIYSFICTYIYTSLYTHIYTCSYLSIYTHMHILLLLFFSWLESWRFLLLPRNNDITMTLEAKSSAKGERLVTCWCEGRPLSSGHGLAAERSLHQPSAYLPFLQDSDLSNQQINRRMWRKMKIDPHL